MHAFLLLSKEPAKLTAYIKKFATSHTISQFDQTHIQEEGSIGIEVVRKIQEKIYLAPFKGKEKMLIINNAQNLTPQAQNALLKILEEPPVGTYIFLFTPSAQDLLPTILSRCQIITLETQDIALSKEEEASLTEDLTILISGTIAERMSLAEAHAKEKETISVWTENLIKKARQDMLSAENPKQQLLYTHLLEELQSLSRIITTTNVSVRTTLEHYFLSL